MNGIHEYIFTTLNPNRTFAPEKGGTPVTFERKTSEVISLLSEKSPERKEAVLQSPSRAPF